MKKMIKRFTASFAAMCIWLLSVPFAAYADIVDEPPVPEPSSSSSSSGAVLIVIGLLVVCVVVASVIILKKIKK